MSSRKETSPVSKSNQAQRPAPPVYRPASTKTVMLPKSAGKTAIETRPAPPVYRPYANGPAATQAKPANATRRAAPAAENAKPPSLSARSTQTQYELSTPVWIGKGRQQIRASIKGAPASIASVDVHYNTGGKAYISDLEVAQGHRRHGVGTMLMKAAMDAARRHGSTATELEAKPGAGSISNQALLGMYTKLGYQNKGISQRGNPRMEKSSAASLQRKTAPVPTPPKFLRAPAAKTIQLMEDDNPYAKPRHSYKTVDKRTARQKAKAGVMGPAVTKPNYSPPKDSLGNKVWDGSRGSLDWNATIKGAMAPSKVNCQLQVSPQCTGTPDGIDHGISFAEVQAGFDRYVICDGTHHWAAVYKDDADAGYNNNNSTKGLCWSCTKCNSKKNGAKGLYENPPKWLGQCPGACGYAFQGEPSGE